MPSQIEKEVLYLKRKVEREKLARGEAKHLLELKSLELYRTKQQLTESIQNLDNTVAMRTAARPIASFID